MKKTTGKIFVLLVIVLCFVIFPSIAGAVELNNTVGQNTASEFSEVTDDGTAENDISQNAKNKNITVDINGKTVTQIANAISDAIESTNDDDYVSMLPPYYRYAGIVTVINTGEPYIASEHLSFHIPAGVTVKWSANYKREGIYTTSTHRCAINLYTSGGTYDGTFEVIEGGSVEIDITDRNYDGGRGGDAIVVERAAVQDYEATEVIINGGAVCAHRGNAINSGGSVTVADGTVQSLGYYDPGSPLYEPRYYSAISADSVVINDGFIFSYANPDFAIDEKAIISANNLSINTPAAAIAWKTEEFNSPPVNGLSYGDGTQDDLIVAPIDATAMWDTKENAKGIYYKNSTNEGFIKISELALPAKPVVIKGDILDTGMPSIRDFAVMAAYLRGMRELNAEQLKAADFNNDSKVDIRDFALFAKMLREL